MTVTTSENKPPLNVAKHLRSIGAIGALAGAAWFGIAAYKDSTNPPPSLVAEHQRTASELVQNANRLVQNESQSWTLRLGSEATDLAKDCIKTNRHLGVVIVAGDKITTYNGFSSKEVAECFERKAADLVRPLAPANVVLRTVSDALAGGFMGGVVAFLALAIIQITINSYGGRREERKSLQKSNRLEP